MGFLRCLNYLNPTLNRQMQTSSVCLMKSWRRSRGLPINKTTYGPLIDLPDYTFLDGRPTPIGYHQRTRLFKQREYAEKIIELSSEIDFAKQRIINMKEAEEAKRQEILSKRLKPKGYAMLRKK